MNLENNKKKKEGEEKRLLEPLCDTFNTNVEAII
jgi:hypothetical protein